MCSSNVVSSKVDMHLSGEEGFSQRMTSNKAHQSVQITKPNHNTNKQEGPRPVVWYQI